MCKYRHKFCMHSNIYHSHCILSWFLLNKCIPSLFGMSVHIFGAWKVHYLIQKPNTCFLPNLYTNLQDKLWTLPFTRSFRNKCLPFCFVLLSIYVFTVSRDTVMLWSVVGIVQTFGVNIIWKWLVENKLCGTLSRPN